MLLPVVSPSLSQGRLGGSTTSFDPQRTFFGGGGGEETIENLIKGIVLATMKFLSYSRLTINHNTSTPYYSVAELYLNP